MKRLLLVAVMVLVALVGMVGASRAQTSSVISNAASALQEKANPTTGAVTELPATVNARAQTKPEVYYLTKNSFTGGDAITACDSRFHLASLSEIQDPSKLQYANRSTAAYASLVDGQRLGPPTNQMGWVRTGVYPPSGFMTDCEDFGGKDDPRLGNTVALYDFWYYTSEHGQPETGPDTWWHADSQGCLHMEPVWCIEDPE